MQTLKKYRQQQQRYKLIASILISISITLSCLVVVYTTPKMISYVLDQWESEDCHRLNDIKISGIKNIVIPKSCSKFLK